MLLQSSVIGLLSLAVAITMLTGGIDLSINFWQPITSRATSQADSCRRIPRSIPEG
jgi:ribose/xylose/arabinose/galactoside ABC-type transport system permease subunit